MTVVGIDTVAVVVPDPRKATAWYRDVLGLPISYIGPPTSNVDPSVEGTPDDPGHWIELGPHRPRTQVHLCRRGGTTEPEPTGITFLTDDIRAEHDQLRAEGVRFLSAPPQMEWGEWLCSFADADGNEFDLKQPADPAASDG